MVSEFLTLLTHRPPARDGRPPQILDEETGRKRKAGTVLGDLGLRVCCFVVVLLCCCVVCCVLCVVCCVLCVVCCCVVFFLFCPPRTHNTQHTT